MAKLTRRTSGTGWVLTLLASLVLIMLIVGCRSAGTVSAVESVPPAEYDVDNGYAYRSHSNRAISLEPPEPEESYETAASSPPAPAPVAKRSRIRASRSPRFERRNARQKKKSYDAAQSKPAAAPEAAPITVDAPEIVEQPRPKPDASNQRQIIYTATMRVSVYDLAHAISVAEALPDQLGGWLHERVNNQLVLRIPAAQLEAAMDQIAELGVVEQRLLEALDVTAQYTDLDSRIRILVEMQAQLEALLLRAKNVEQALKIRTALDKITLELELARAQMRELAKSIAFSTLILQFVERGPKHPIPSSNDPFRWVDELGVEITEYR